MPQGSYLGPVLFLLYASKLFDVVKNHFPSAHAFADDTKIYFSFKPDSQHSQDRAVHVIEKCIADIRTWMVTHRLMINDSKTEFLIIGSRGQLSKINVNSITVGDSSIEPVKSVRNLGSWFDEHMAMDILIGNICSKAFKGLYNIRQRRKFISTEASKILVHAFVTLHLDYCNSLLSGVPQYQLNRLQKILNIAARLVCLVPKFDHITHYLIDLHWLPVAFRIKFKVLIFVFKALNGVAPRYISDLIRKKSDGAKHLLV